MGKTESKVSWTEEQQKVIDLRNRNILVSAAAGSGKTAVLVERIITMISDKENPVDIDRLLVVTFTNAAAAEMSERIATALEKKVEQEPDNMHLRRQVTLVRNAQICTFHSFCQSVIRNHFNEIGMDPSFRIGDETELKLMKNDIITNIFEVHYKKYNEKKKAEKAGGDVLKKEDKAFVELVECYSSAKSDAGLQELILQLYEFSMSAPWPEVWLDSKKGNFSCEAKEEMEQSHWMQLLMDYVKQITEDILVMNKNALELAASPYGPVTYMDNFIQDKEVLEGILGCRTYGALSEYMQNLSWSRLSTKKGQDVDENKKKAAKAMRDSYKAAVEDLKKKFFFQSADQMYEDMCQLQFPMNTLLDLVKEFKDAFAKEKEERRVVDFNDLEHFALSILLDPQTKEPTAVAEQYRDLFAEILVDEYQDSNEVQETILRSIAKKEPENPNLFMVGDVKQSIYKFRMARPELFMEKYDTYSMEESKYQRIDLHKNFRSRSVVLNTVNEIFEVIMKRSLGNVEYDKDAALYLGNESFPESDRSSKTTELLLYCPETAEEEGASKEEDAVTATKVELEARMVAARIKELVDGENGLQVVDKKSGELRTCGYGDIAILLRSMSGYSDVYLETLKNLGIPVYTDTRTGYFSTFEIRTILQLLKVLDNPRQEIPLTAVMRSMIGGFTAEAMAVIRSRYPDCPWYEAVEAYSGLYEYEDAERNGVQVELSRRLDAFCKKIEKMREKVIYTPIHLLLEEIYEETGFYEYVSVMPNGAQRKDNLDMLVQKALDMEAAQMSTLFHFNRYIEKLHKYEVDFGEAVGTATTGNAVRIMSIHKSKGLEFPVVFVGAMGKGFNNQDSMSKLVLHLDLGIGADLIDYEKRTKVKSLIKNVIAKQNVLENMGEELRVLYVALTRAKEKLIMAGVVDKLETIDGWHLQNGQMDYFTRVNAKNYLDWVAPVVLESASGEFEMRQYTLSNLVQYEMKEQIKAAVKMGQLTSWNPGRHFHEGLQQKINERESFLYKYEKEKEIKSKMTVSELKHSAMELLEQEEMGELKFQAESEPNEVPLPVFMKEEETISGASRGTLYHKVFEKLQIDQVNRLEDVTEELNRLVCCGFLTEEEKLIIKPDKIYEFTKSELGKRMEKAKQQNRLWREQPFVIGISAKQIKEEWDSEEFVLVQGIIDAYFEEEGQLVIVDYKTDRVSTSEQLAKKYAEQLKYYKRALEQLTGKKVKEQILYSVYLDKQVVL